MEAFLIENPNIISTEEEISVKFITNQLFIEQGRQSLNTDGRIDMLFEIDEKYLAIIELKKGVIIDDNIEQLKDYIHAFRIKRDELYTKYAIQLDRELIGIIIGADIDPEIKKKLLSGSYKQSISEKIVGVSISRYCSEDRTEVYIFAERYAEEKSDFTKIRFTDFDDFINFQQYEKNIDINTVNILKYLYEQKDSNNKVNADWFSFTKNALTFNVDSKKKKTVYLYLAIYKKKIRAYLLIRGNIPNGYILNSDKRFDNYYYDINNIEDMTEEFFMKIEESYNLIRGNNLTIAST